VHVAAVTFDLWETLMHDSREKAGRRGQMRIERMHAALARTGSRIGRDAVELAYQEIWRWLETDYWQRHVDPGFEVQIEWFCHRLDITSVEVAGELRAGYVEPIFALPPEPDPEALPLLLELRQRGLRLGLICNTSITPGFALRRLLSRWGLGQLLAAQIYSDELGIRKPSAAIFREAARLLQVDIRQMLHVGDRADMDVEGAQAAGAQALQVGPDLALSQLRSRLL